MFAVKRELKLNNKEASQMRGNAGFKRFVYNYGLELAKASWSFENIKANNSKRIDAIKKFFTQVTMKKPEYAWMKQYPSTVYQSSFRDLIMFNIRKNLEYNSIFLILQTVGGY